MNTCWSNTLIVSMFYKNNRSLSVSLCVPQNVKPAAMSVPSVESYSTEMFLTGTFSSPEPPLDDLDLIEDLYPNISLFRSFHQGVVFILHL